MGKVRRIKIFTKGTLNWFDWFLIVGIVVCNLAYMAIAKSVDWMGFAAGVSGLACVVLISKKSISNFLFGIVNAATYAIIAFETHIYGDAALNAFYYFPMQFVGWYNWSRNNGGTNAKGESDESLVKTRYMSVGQRIVWSIICLVGVVGGGYILDNYTLDPEPYKDAFTTVTSVIAMYLMIKAYMEQWIIWFFVNSVSVLVWLGVLLDGDITAGLMVIMWAFYLIVTINGWYFWSKEAS